MAIYNKDGQNIASLYDKNGSDLSQAYDLNGNIIYMSEPTTIKVMSYNVGNWYIGSGTNVPVDKKSEYETLQGGILSRNACDVCAVQEYWNNFCADGTTAVSILDDYYSSIDTIDGNTTYMGKAICMNMTPKTKTTQNYTQQGTHKRFRINVVEINGHDVYFISCHLDWSNKTTQYSQVQDLLNYVADKEYFVLCGDFNPSVHVDEDRTGTDYINICKPFIDAGYNMANWKTSFIPTSYNGTTIEDSTAISCLDNIITSSNIALSDVYVDTTKLTDNIGDTIDHLPIVATLMI